MSCSLDFLFPFYCYLLFPSYVSRELMLLFPCANTSLGIPKAFLYFLCANIWVSQNLLLMAFRQGWFCTAPHFLWLKFHFCTDRRLFFFSNAKYICILKAIMMGFYDIFKNTCFHLYSETCKFLTSLVYHSACSSHLPWLQFSTYMFCPGNASQKKTLFQGINSIVLSLLGTGIFAQKSYL